MTPSHKGSSSMNIFQGLAFWARQTEEAMVLNSLKHPSPLIPPSSEPAHCHRRQRRRRKTSSVTVPVVPSQVVPSLVVLVPVVPVPVVSSLVVWRRRRRRRRKTSCLPNGPEAVPSEQPAVVPEAVPSEQPAVIPEIVSEPPTISPATARRVVFLFYAVAVLQAWRKHRTSADPETVPEPVSSDKMAAAKSVHVTSAEPVSSDKMVAAQPVHDTPAEPVSCISGVDDHVFISSGENVRLSCNNALSDCKSKTTWHYSNRFRHTEAVELITLGIKKKDTERHERLSLESDCSLNIKNGTEEDYGFYTCRQYVNDRQQGSDARVSLHVLHVSVSPSPSSSSSSSSQTEISPGRSLTLSCQLYSDIGFSCDKWQMSRWASNTLRPPWCFTPSTRLSPESVIDRFGAGSGFWGASLASISIWPWDQWVVRCQPVLMKHHPSTPSRHSDQEDHL
ncbi:unnamed protein product [Leuciscus chuanchicus]